MRLFASVAATMLMCVGLAGCFTSTTLLIGGDEADAEDRIVAAE